MKLEHYVANSVVDQQIEDYYLPEEQAIFSRLPKDAIEECHRNFHMHPVILLDQEKLRTFFILHEKEGTLPYTTNENALLLRSFSTDYPSQRQGYSENALRLLDDFVREHFPSIDEIILGVNAVNHGAIALYLKCGYADEGKRKKTDYGELLILSKKI